MLDTYLAVLERHAALRGAQDAYIYLEGGEEIGETLTYAGLRDRAQSVAAVLQTHGKEGDRVLLLYPSCIDYMVAFFACLYAKMIAVPVFPPRNSKHNARLETIVADSGAELAMTTTRQLHEMRHALETSPALRALTMVCSDTVEKTDTHRWRPTTVDGDTTAFLQYTSGSTGQPKGVVVTHRNLIENAKMQQAGMRTTGDSLIVTWLPIFHDMGLIGNMLHAVWLGAQCVFMAPAFFLQSPRRWLAAISKFGAQMSGGPNFSFDLCVDRITAEQAAELDLSRWRVAFNGAEPVRAATLERFSKHFAVSGFRRAASYPCYGMAETTLIVTGGTADAGDRVEWVTRSSLSAGRPDIVAPNSAASSTTSVEALPIVSCGRALPGCTVTIVTPNKRTLCGEREVGEIWVAGAHVGKGYWQKPDITLQTFAATTVPEMHGPYLRTGDLGYLSDGELYVTGRCKDLLIIRGTNYYPNDIEQSIEACDAAVMRNGIAVIGIDDERGERAVAVAEIERTQLHKINAAALVGIIRQSVLEKHELFLADIVLIRPGTLPKTSSGKVQRGRCRELYLAGQLTLAIEPARAPRSTAGEVVP